MPKKKKSIIPSSGDYISPDKWYSNTNFTQGPSGLFSAAGWTVGNEGFIQQTFLGASIRSFNITAGFGDTSSTLSVQLVNDEYNKSDRTGLGWGDDVYHSGNNDEFRPPQAGSPVFFKFGKNFATNESAWMKTFDDLYGYNKVKPYKKPNKRFANNPNSPSGFFPELNDEECEYIDLENSIRPSSIWSIQSREQFCGETYEDYQDKRYVVGQNHIVFGGILQSYIQNNGPDANAAFSVQVVDPREILSNVTVILNNYAGSVYNNKNYYNVYGFLEHDISDELKDYLKSRSIPGFNIGPIESSGTWISEIPQFTSPIIGERNFNSINQPINSLTYINLKGTIFNFTDKKDNLLEKVVDQFSGDIFYFGNDMYRFPVLPQEFVVNQLPEFLPITGEGFSRRCDQGIPWYRVRQGLNALFNQHLLPEEYKEAGYGSYINFRGYNYIADFSGIPVEKIPQMYFLDFDQIDLLSLCQELCDVISHDMFVSLLPIIDHPACKYLYEYNKAKIAEALASPSDSEERRLALSKVVAGIIRVDSIDRSYSPRIGAIKEYLEDLEKQNVYVENKDLGYELSNITTDKFVVGAQEVEMYYFNNNKDRDCLQFRKRKAAQPNHHEWLTQNQWSLETSLKQQILPFYGFLGKEAVTIPRGFGSYQQIMLDSSGLEAYGVGNYYIATEMELRAALVSFEQWSDFLFNYNETFIEEIGDDYVFYKDLVSSIPLNITSLPIDLQNREFGVSAPRCVFMSDRNYMGPDGYPASPCAPPYGYPLYYKRAEKIGIPKAGVVNILNRFYDIISKWNELKESTDSREELLTLKQEVGFSFKNTFYNSQFTDDKSLSFEEIRQKQIQLDEIQKKLEKAESDAEKETIIFNALKANENLEKNLKRTAIQFEKNAKKVYEFVRNVAEQHLGKKFLIKIPKQCNLNYKNEIFLSNNDALQVNNILYGPYGFQPIPIYSGIGYFLEQKNLDALLLQKRMLSRFNYSSGVNGPIGTDIFQHYLDYDVPKTNKYTYGALKNNFNPISEKWEFNYKPEPQGGFFNFAMFDRNLSVSQFKEISNEKVPFAQKQLLTPMDLTNFINDNGRIGAYVRYDHSEFLDLSSLGSDNFSQQVLTINGFIPDILEELDNVDPDSKESYDEIKKRVDNSGIYSKKPSCVAFVKCEIDENFYMIPELQALNTKVFGRTFVWNKNTPPGEEVKIIKDGCEVTSLLRPYALFSFAVGPSGGLDGTKARILDFRRTYSKDLNGEIINTEKENLNSDHVYAIITIPGRIMPTADQRFMDSINQSMHGVGIKHLLTADVVRGAPGFDKPAPIINNKSSVCKYLSYDTLAKATIAKKRLNEQLSIADPEATIGFIQPSPVYPDLVVLPLMSRERCYGPWLSSSILNGIDDRKRYSDLGGKVEFVKDENLAPWNYAGYQLMNEAGSLQAQFSNSLLLYTERGGFVIPDMPSGIALAKTLKDGGPLVTSISVDIGDSVKTTVKLDLYTSRFGKLQKQKEEAIAQIVRERQKIIDRNNKDIRKSAGKALTSASLASNRELLNASQLLSSLERKQTIQNTISITCNKTTISGIDLNDQDNKLSKDIYAKSVAIQPKGYINQTMSLIEDENQKNSIAYRSATANMNEIFEAYSNEPDNPYLPSILPVNTNAILENMG